MTNTLSVAALLVVAQLARGQAGAVESWLATRAAPAQDRFAARFRGDLDIAVSGTRVVQEQGREVHSTSRATARRRGRMLLLSSESATPARAGGQLVTGLNGRYYFELRRDGASDPWAVLQVLALPPAGGEEMPASARDLAGRVDGICTALLGVPIAGSVYRSGDLSSAPGFRVTDAEVAGAGGSVLTLRYACRPAGRSGEAAATGVVRFDAAAFGLATHASETARSADDAATRTRDISITPANAGFVVTTVTADRLAEGGRVTRITNSEAIAEVQFEGPPAAAFYLSAFGLAEPPGLGPPPTPSVVWVALVAGVLAVAAARLRLLARRRAGA